jgi:hypothetical protein
MRAFFILWHEVNWVRIVDEESGPRIDPDPPPTAVCHSIHFDGVDPLRWALTLDSMDGRLGQAGTASRWKPSTQVHKGLRSGRRLNNCEGVWIIVETWRKMKYRPLVDNLGRLAEFG